MEKLERVNHTCKTQSKTGTESTTSASSDQKPEEKKKHHLPFLHKSGNKEKRASISDSGPYIFAVDPNTGKEVLQQNPHWPNEDSWKRVEESKGKWAMGSEMGDPREDFGGTVG